MKTSDFHFDLPRELIAQEPLSCRSDSRMMVVHRQSGELEHRQVADLPLFLKKGDLLVVNNTKVIPARVFGRRVDTGGRVELLLVEKLEHQASEGSGHAELWDVFYRASGRPRVGMHVLFAGGRLDGEVIFIGKQGRVSLRLSGDSPVLEILEQEGFAPVPPYIHRPEEVSLETERDKECYQTVYAKNPGAVAAPTAGLHFTPELLQILQQKGINKTELTLHVGPGTFKPVKVEDVEKHVMEAERYEVGDESAVLINATRNAGGRIAAVGSTTVRTLETIMRDNAGITACTGRTSLFIYPPYSFRIVDLMMTNFHLPESSLIMMVSAFAGKDLIMKAYREAVRLKYRFYSYGDCMLII